jgi:ApbE superfamily uncharacterized protein (UPF0280 family)
MNTAQEFSVEMLVSAMRLIAALDRRLGDIHIHDDEDLSVGLLVGDSQDHLRHALRNIKRIRLILEMQDSS